MNQANYVLSMNPLMVLLKSLKIHRNIKLTGQFGLEII